MCQRSLEGTMKIIILSITLFVGIVFTNHSAYAVPYFADTIADYNSGTGLDFTGDEHIPRALGPSDLVFVTIGETGYMTFSFDDFFVINGTGNDVRIYTTSHSIFNEPADVSASLDGIHFSSLGFLDQNRSSIFVGNGPNYEIYYEEFDLDSAGINKARYLKVTDLAGGFVATDLDAVAILNTAAIPEGNTSLYFALGILALSLIQMKMKDTKKAGRDALGGKQGQTLFLKQ